MENTPDIFEATAGKAPATAERSYIEDFQEYLERLRTQEVTGREIGEMIVYMANHFIRHNLIMMRSMKLFMKVKSEIQGRVDEITGKPITSAKADTLAAATPESFAYEEARTHLQNIQEAINALKAFQRGALNEYSNQ